MGHKFAELAFTPTVRALQSDAGSRVSYAAMDSGAAYNHLMTEREAAFIAARDSLYMASVSETGWPYIQHRGGPSGFMKILDAKTLGFADYSGNRQYVTTGNLKSDNRISLFFMDYPNRRRLKMLGRVEIIESDDTQTLARLVDDNYLATIERGFLIHIEAFDWNCPQHITPRFTEIEAREIFEPTVVVSDLSATTSDLRDQTESDSVLGNGPLQLIVSGIRQQTKQIRSYELTSTSGEKLPLATPGAHLRIPMRLSDGTLVDREYSISNVSDGNRYEIAVQREPDGRGGSEAVHGSFTLGSRLNVELPINLFPLHEDKRPALLIAGGIGITPIRSMAQQLTMRNQKFVLHYSGRTKTEMAFVEELNVTLGERLAVHTSDTGDRLDIPSVLQQADSDALVYICGPKRLIVAVRKVARELDIADNRIHFETFE
jgi:ferredoxin-NADP reductase/predicted pyridoxine 5'-phosphate oxidase superfamily flavin-nucleotide-binding protein